MKKKIFALLIIFCILTPIFILGSYQIGVNSGYTLGKNDGIKGVGDNLAQSSQKIYQNGYRAGLAAQNQTSP